MTDTNTNGNKGKRIAGARVKGADAAKAGKSRENPYKRPNMVRAWFEGFDSVAEVSAATGALDVQG